MSNVAGNIHNTMGAMFVGLVVSTILYGVSCIQTWQYFMAYPKDSRWLKLLVAAVVITETVHLIIITDVMYYYTITNFANPLALNLVYKPIVAQVLPNGFAAMIVQLFYAHRIWRLSEKSWLHTVPVLVCIVVQWAVNIGYSITTFQITNFAMTSKGWTGALDVTSALTDIVISAILVLLLQNSRTDYDNTNNLINKLILFSLNTGLVTTVCAIAAMVFYYALPNTLIYIGIYVLLPRLYSNSLLATLNARSYIRGQNTPQVSYSLGERRGRQGENLSGSRPQHHGISVQIETMKETTADSRSDFEVSKKAESMV